MRRVPANERRLTVIRPTVSSFFSSVRFYTSQHVSETQQQPSVKSVASILYQMSYSNKGLMAAMIVAGYDPASGGKVFGSPIGGTLVEMPWAIEGRSVSPPSLSLLICASLLSSTWLKKNAVKCFRRKGKEWNPY